MAQDTTSIPSPSPSILNPWETSTNWNAFVPIGTHNLHLQASGPTRKPGDPVAIIIQGLSATASSWAAVSRLLYPHIRVYRYDRSGFGLSESSPLPPTAGNIALELELMLQAANIKPPYILIAHSWGGIVAREFFARRKEGEVVGAVFVEANQERTLRILDWRPFFLWCAGAGVDFMKVSGLETSKKLDDEEWRLYLEDMGREQNKRQGEKEWGEYEGSFETLTKKGQLDTTEPLLRNAAVSVIKGKNGDLLRRLFDAVLKIGSGSEDEREKFKEFLRTFDEKDLELQSEIRQLSSNTRFVEARNSGHDVQLTEPEVIVEEIKWVMGQYHAPN